MMADVGSEASSLVSGCGSLVSRTSGPPLLAPPLAAPPLAAPPQQPAAQRAELSSGSFRSIVSSKSGSSGASLKNAQAKSQDPFSPKVQLSAQRGWLPVFPGFIGGAFDCAKIHKRERRKRQSVSAKREKSQTPKFV